MKMRSTWGSNDILCNIDDKLVYYQADVALDKNLDKGTALYKSEVLFQATAQQIGHCLRFDLANFTARKCNGKTCYRINNGFFLNMEIFITLYHCHLHVVFIAAQLEQAYALRNEIPKIKKKLTCETQDCTIEVIFENSRM